MRFSLIIKIISSHSFKWFAIHFSQQRWIDHLSSFLSIQLMCILTAYFSCSSPSSPHPSLLDRHLGKLQLLKPISPSSNSHWPLILLIKRESWSNMYFHVSSLNQIADRWILRCNIFFNFQNSVHVCRFFNYGNILDN